MRFFLPKLFGDRTRIKRIMSVIETLGLYSIAMFVCGAVLYFASSNAHAVFLTPLDKTPSQVKVCPKADCPVMTQHPFGPGSRVVVYETKGGWARVSKFISPDKIATQFPGQLLPNQVAMWIPAKDLPEVATSSPSIKKAIEEEEALKAKRLAEEERKKKARAFSFIPKRPAIPSPRSDGAVRVAALEVESDVKSQDTATDSTESVIATEQPVAKAPTGIDDLKRAHKTDPLPEPTPVVVEAKEETETTEEIAAPTTEETLADTTEAAEPEAPVGEPAPDAPIPTKSVRKAPQEAETAKEEEQREVETAKLEEPKQEETTEVDTTPEAEEEEAVETDSFGNPIISKPKKLTKELRDKRLAKLPSKPTAQFDLKTIIAMRHHGLQLIKDGECAGIAEGGRSLSLAGWIYLRCDNDPTFRQFSVE